MLRRGASKLISGGAGYFCVTLCSLSCLQCALSLPLCYLMRPAVGKYIFSFWQNFSARAVSCCFSVFSGVFCYSSSSEIFHPVFFFFFVLSLDKPLRTKGSWTRARTHTHVHARICWYWLFGSVLFCSLRVCTLYFVLTILRKTPWTERSEMSICLKGSRWNLNGSSSQVVSINSLEIIFFLTVTPSPFLTPAPCAIGIHKSTQLHCA